MLLSRLICFSTLAQFFLSAGAERQNSGPESSALAVEEAHSNASAPTTASNPTGFFAYMGNDAISIDHVNAEEKLRKERPVLQDDEHVVMAFKVGRDKTFFTNRRILFRPKGIIQRTMVDYKTVLYSSILAFAVEQAGKWPDMDTELKLWTKMPGMSAMHMSFRKGTRKEKVDVFEVYKFIMEKVMGPDSGSASLLEQKASLAPDPTGLFHWLGNNAHEIEVGEAEEYLRAAGPILRTDERVEMAFKVGRDMKLLTSQRMLLVDTNWLNTANVEYKTIPYCSMKAFAVRSAGSWDTDSEISVWTEIKNYGMNHISFDLRKGQGDLQKIQNYLAYKVLGDSGDKSRALPEGSHVSEDSSPGNIIDWLGNNLKSVDPANAELAIRTKFPSLLLGDEAVEMAFRVGRDRTLLTTRRMLCLDVKGLTGEKVEFKSLPYTSIHAFAVRSAGYFDRDSEFMVWTAIQPPPEPGGKNPPPPPPGMAFISQDLRNGKADIFAIQDLLAQKVLGGSSGSSSLLQQESVADDFTGSPADIVHWLGDNAAQIDPRTVDAKFRKDMPILQSDEHIEMAFNVGRDTTLLTSKRAIFVNTIGVSALFGGKAKKVMYRSVPYTSVHAFAVTSAGTFDTDAEFHMYTSMPWLSVVRQDLRRGMADVAAIQQFFCSKVLGDAPRAEESLLETVQSVNPIDWLQDNAKQIDVAEVEQKLRIDPPVLQRDEQIKFAFKSGRDTSVITTKRLVLIDVQGLTGTKVMVRSIPYQSIIGFGVQTAGSFWDRSDEIYAYTDMPSLAYYHQNLKRGNSQLFEVQKFLADKYLAL